MNCRTLLPVAPRVVGVETQRKGKEVKRRGGENHVCSCTALSFLGRLVFVSVYPLQATSSPALAEEAALFCHSSTDSLIQTPQLGGFCCDADCRSW